MMDPTKHAKSRGDPAAIVRLINALDDGDFRSVEALAKHCNCTWRTIVEHTDEDLVRDLEFTDEGRAVAHGVKLEFAALLAEYYDAVLPDEFFDPEELAWEHADELFPEFDEAPRSVELEGSPEMAFKVINAWR